MATNYDVIRNMTVEQLAEFLATERFNIVKPLFEKLGFGITKEAVYITLLAWLKSEVK